MTNQPHRQALTEHFQNMKNSEGLTDMKFHLGKVSETTTEPVYAEVNTLLKNRADGKVQEVVSWHDSYGPKKT